MLEKGLAESDIKRATEIILALESDYVSPTVQASTPPWFYFLLIGGLLHMPRISV
jgi:hypothetical protein